MSDSSSDSNLSLFSFRQPSNKQKRSSSRSTMHSTDSDQNLKWYNQQQPAAPWTPKTKHAPLYLLYTLTSSGRLSPVDIMGHPRPSSDNTEEAWVISALSGYLPDQTICCCVVEKRKRKKGQRKNRKIRKYFCHFCSPKKNNTTKKKPSHQTPLHFKTATWQPPPSHVQQFVVPQERRVGEGVRTPHRHPCGSTKGSRVVAAVAIPHHQHPTVVVQRTTTGTCEQHQIEKKGQCWSSLAL